MCNYSDPAIHPALLMAAWIRHAKRDQAEKLPFIDCAPPRQSPAYATHQAVYARLNQQGNHAPVAAGRVDADQARHS